MKIIAKECWNEGGKSLQNVLVVGGGKGGKAILEILKETTFRIVAVVDPNEQAEGMGKAREAGIKTGAQWRDWLNDNIDIIFDVTGDEGVFREIREARSKNTVLIPGSIAYLIAQLIEEKGELITTLMNETYKRDLIFNSTDEGMVVIDKTGKVIYFNKSAERMTGVSQQDAVGNDVRKVIPDTKMLRVLQTRVAEINQKGVLDNGLNIIATRIPMINEQDELMGALSVFKDTTEVVRLAEEVTNLKEIQTMLEAIIFSSDDAISVVDERGNGILINPAYTRITGLTKEQVIGKPATADISEGESMHLKVLNTRKAVRGVKMLLGPLKKEVIVNVAPIIVNDTLKGSIGVVHDVSEIQTLTKELDRARQIIRTLEAKYTFADIIGDSEEMSLAVGQAKLGAKTPATILLRGESGTGKELFAHAIHHTSNRRYNKFVRVNCAAISESLLESELFGYEDGAFSGAKKGGKKGLFEEANYGSIFLDEIGELSANTQAKLLRVLQEHEIVRVGGTKAIPIHVRIIAATNVNLERRMAEGTFREDLYYRLNRMPIHIPPLRMRKGDIPGLCHRLIQKINQDYGRNVEGVTSCAMKTLFAYEWPGNVRELENILGRAMIFMQFNETHIDVKHLQFLKSTEWETPKEEQTRITAVEEHENLASLLLEYERTLILQRLKQNKGNKTLTAKQLGISIRSLYYKLEKFSIDKSSMQ